MAELPSPETAGHEGESEPGAGGAGCAADTSGEELYVSEALELALEWRRDEGQPFPGRAQVIVKPVTIPGC